MTYNLLNQVFDQLTVVEKLPYKDARGKVLWKAICSCGDFKIAETYCFTRNIKQLTTCGKCLWQVKHTNAYNTWEGLKSRCDNPNNKDYSNYGGRGIKYDPAWKRFVLFYLDMGDPPFSSVTGERLSLDRVDNDGDYTKANCVWSTRSEQQLNKHRKLDSNASYAWVTQGDTK